MRSPLRSLPNKRSLASKRKQKGAVAIVLGLSLVTLFAMGGVVLDLGHLYIAKSELQNAADAAALSGAKELKETAASIDLAVSKARAIGLKNNYNFSTAVDLDNSDSSLEIQFGPSPDGPWSTIAQSRSAPAGKTFIQVDTRSKSLNTYLMRVLTTANANFDTVSTFGYAVAGRYVVDISPIGVCAIDPNTKGGIRTGTNELTEFGFRRGVSYNIPSLNPLGSPRDPFFINPTAYPGGPIACTGSQSNVPNTASSLCTGTSTAIPTLSGSPSVYVNTGASVSLERAINSRFNQPAAAAPTSPCNAGAVVGGAPPDSNIKSYIQSVASNWIEQTGSTYPSRQTIEINTTTLKPVDYPNLSPLAAKYGVLWSFNPAVQAVGSSPNATEGAPFAPTNANWALLYNNNVTTFPSGNNLLDPSYPNSRTPYDAPYEKTAGIYFTAPVSGGVKYRRVLNVAILNCLGYSSGGACSSTLPVKGIGRFFMLSPANLNPGGGQDPKIEVEFAGLISPVPKAEIKLYR